MESGRCTCDPKELGDFFVAGRNTPCLRADGGRRGTAVEHGAAAHAVQAGVGRDEIESTAGTGDHEATADGCAHPSNGRAAWITNAHARRRHSGA